MDASEPGPTAFSCSFMFMSCFRTAPRLTPPPPCTWAPPHTGHPGRATAAAQAGGCVVLFRGQSCVGWHTTGVPVLAGDTAPTHSGRPRRSPTSASPSPHAIRRTSQPPSPPPHLPSHLLSPSIPPLPHHPPSRPTPQAPTPAASRSCWALCPWCVSCTCTARRWRCTPATAPTSNTRWGGEGGGEGGAEG